jgi:SAM-dependent methyltransferase
MPTAAPSNSSTANGNDWTGAGRAWGARALDWAFLAESGASQVYETVLDEIAVNARTRLLDVACGSGGALVSAARRGAFLSGIDAAEELIRIARRRLPDADIRHGTMFHLPFDAASVDVVTSFNGIWSDNATALAEVRRVITPGGRVALTFWDFSQPSDHLHVLAGIVQMQDERHAQSSIRQGETGTPGLVEDMLRNAGFMPRRRASAPVTHEWPDLDIAIRALLSSGPAWAAIDHRGEPAVHDAVATALESFKDADLGVRLRSQYQYVIADA